MNMLLWASAILALAMALAMLEIFIPSGGVLGFLSAAGILAAILLAFRHGPWYGLGFVGIAVLLVPVGVALALQIWPKTPFGRKILLPTRTADEVLPDNESRRTLRSLVGKVGHAKSLMLPSGAVEIEGHTVDAVSEGMAIEAGQLVRVIEVRGTRVVVQPCEVSKDGIPESDPLSRPVEELGIDPFDDEPLA